MEVLKKELRTLFSLRKKTLLLVAVVFSFIMSFVLTSLDGVVSGIADGINGTHEHDPRNN